MSKKNWAPYWAALLAKHRALVAFGAIPPVGAKKARIEKPHPWEKQTEEQNGGDE